MKFTTLPFFLASALTLQAGTTSKSSKNPSPEPCEYSSCHPSPLGHAPIGVMADHTHNAGEWMLSYRYMHMAMDGHRAGTNFLSSHEVFEEGFDVAAESMDMEMHMFGAMFAPTDKITLMVMSNYERKDMTLRSSGASTHAHSKSGEANGETAHSEGLTESHKETTTDSHGDSHSSAGSEFGHDSEGWGDTTVGALYSLCDNAHLQLGLSLPTGDVGVRQHGNLLPYGMQLGSGTYDLKIGSTVTGHADGKSWGAQATGTLPLESENKLGYALGNRLDATVWGAIELHEKISASLRLAYTYQDDISGHYNVDHPHAAPPHFTDNYGGHALDLGVGVNTVLFGGHRLALEALIPLHQDLNGIGMERELSVIVGWQWAL